MPSSAPRSEHDRQYSTVLLGAADLARDRKEWDKQIKYLDSYLATMDKQADSANFGRTRSPPRGEARAGLSGQGRRRRQRGKKEAANADRARAFVLWDSLQATAKGWSLDILPGDSDDKNLKRWIPRTVSDPEGQRPHLRQLRLLLDVQQGLLVLVHQIRRPTGMDDVRLRWRWKLDRMPTGTLVNKVSVNHPLGVTVVFNRPSRNEIVAMQYVWDPVEEKGRRWVGTDRDAIQFGPFTYHTAFPVVVVASPKDELHAWHDVEVDIGADYRGFFHEPPPPIRAVMIFTDCHNGPPGEARIAEGSVGALQFVEKAKAPPAGPGESTRIR